MSPTLAVNCPDSLCAFDPLVTVSGPTLKMVTAPGERVIVAAPVTGTTASPNIVVPVKPAVLSADKLYRAVKHRTTGPPTSPGSATIVPVAAAVLVNFASSISQSVPVSVTELPTSAKSVCAVTPDPLPKTWPVPLHASG